MLNSKNESQLNRAAEGEVNVQIQQILSFNQRQMVKTVPLTISTVNIRAQSYSLKVPAPNLTKKVQEKKENKLQHLAQKSLKVSWEAKRPSKISV